MMQHQQQQQQQQQNYFGGRGTNNASAAAVSSAFDDDPQQVSQLCREVVAMQLALTKCHHLQHQHEEVLRSECSDVESSVLKLLSS